MKWLCIQILKAQLRRWERKLDQHIAWMQGVSDWMPGAFLDIAKYNATPMPTIEECRTELFYRYMVRISSLHRKIAIAKAKLQKLS